MQPRQPGTAKHGGEGGCGDGQLVAGGQPERGCCIGSACEYRSCGLSAGRRLLQPDRGTRETVRGGGEPWTYMVGDEEGRCGDGDGHLRACRPLDWSDVAGGERGRLDRGHTGDVPDHAWRVDAAVAEAWMRYDSRMRAGDAARDWIGEWLHHDCELGHWSGWSAVSAGAVSGGGLPESWCRKSGASERRWHGVGCGHRAERSDRDDLRAGWLPVCIELGRGPGTDRADSEGCGAVALHIGARRELPRPYFLAERVAAWVAPSSAPRRPGALRREASNSCKAWRGWFCSMRRETSCSRAGRMGPGVTGSFSMASSSSAAERSRAAASSGFCSACKDQAVSS